MPDDWSALPRASRRPFTPPLRGGRSRAAPPPPHCTSPAAERPLPSPQSTRLVVVQGITEGATDNAASARVIRSAGPTADAAVRAAFQQLPYIGWMLLGALPLPPLLLGTGWGWEGRGGHLVLLWGLLWCSATLALALQLLRAPGHLPRAARTAARKLMAWVVAACLAMALPAWLGQGSPAEFLTVWMVLAAAFAVATAAAVSAHIPAMAAAASLPLLMAPAAGHSRAWVMALGATTFALSAGWQARQRWRQLMRQSLELKARLHAAERERDAATRNDKDKSRFLAIASHDLRQPVHALGLFAATLHKRLARAPEEALARNLMRAVDGLERSFNAMLDISRLDGGAISPRMQSFALRDVFRRLHMQYAGQAELAGLGLRFSPGGRSVTSDPQLLERIIGNLVQNAIRYTHSGGVVVLARRTSTHVNVEVWDTGAGIAEAELPRIFEEFYQVGRAERDRSQGLGMGLAIVKRLAALLEHRLEVVSRPGRGTLFRLGVPLGEMGGADEEANPADTLPMTVEVSQMVLVVDDEEPIREGLRMLLQEWGYQAMTAADAAQAEQAVAALEGRVDLIVSDLHLGPGPGGREVIVAVRRLCGREVPAILVTGDTAGQALRDVAVGADTVLFKPVQPRHLFEAVRSALR
jgi:two-component system, sensor histidine kinase